MKRFALLSSVFTFLLLMAAQPGFAQNAPALFADFVADTTPYASPQEADPTVKRFRIANINFGILSPYAAKQFIAGNKDSAPASVRLNLFDNVSYNLTLTKAEFSSDHQTVKWIGVIDGQKMGQAVFAITGDVMMGNISTDYGPAYQVRWIAPGVHTVREIDMNKLPPEGEPRPVELNKAPSEGTTVGKDDGSTIDVMVVYTPSAETAMGGSAATATMVELAVSETNQGYSNSGINQRINLVYKGKVSYTESSGSSGFDNALDDVTGTSDGKMDDVHTLRNTYGADLVSLWINNSSYCGLAWMMTASSISTSFASSGFSVVHYDCATGYYSFGHEMGHNMGSHHDRYVASGSAAYSYSYGYVQNSAPTPFRTVMAYSNACNGCSRVNYYSNPDVKYNSYATGVSSAASDSADNHLSINNTAYTVANFRTSVSTGGTNVTHALTAPTTTTVARGGQLGPFIGKTTNSGSSSATVKVQAIFTKPDSSSWSGEKTSITLSAGASDSHTVYVSVASTAATGAWTHTVKLFDSAGTQLDSDSFSFTITAADVATGGANAARLANLKAIPGVKTINAGDFELILVPNR